MTGDDESDIDRDEDEEEEAAEDEDVTAAPDVDLRPGPNADLREEVERYISGDVRNLYDVYSYRHAAAVLASSYPAELAELQEALLGFRITTREIGMPGGNESEMPKKFSRFLRPKQWLETQVQGDLHVRLQAYDEVEVPGKLKPKRVKRFESEPRVVQNYIDGHKIDYVKGRVAFDLEWNSKDQTFDRDLYAFRAFHDCGLISAGVLVTRSASLNQVFEVVPSLKKDGTVKVYQTGAKKGNPMSCKGKYGASTTWMGKLLYRLNAGRHGGCPVLVFGITPKLISDWKGNE